MNEVPPWPQIIQDQLRTLGSEAKQLEYERKVPHVDITVELVCGWFDDMYHPKDAAFQSCFTASQLEALAEFNEFFDQRVELLPESKGTVTTWLASPIWREVMNAASKTLARIAV
ncbi:MAG: hypothetical protein AB7V47_15825 [Phycisphaerales bacterium]